MFMVDLRRYPKWQLLANKMEQHTARNHDQLDFNAVRQCQAVRELSRYTPPNKGDTGTFDAALSRADAVSDGMRYVMYPKDERKD